MTTSVKKSSYQLQIDCEVANEVLSECLAYFAKRLSAEKKRETSDQDKINALEAQLTELHNAKMELSLERADIVSKALHVWAPLLGKEDL